jgi:D-2-hydroxyacid dehydrogenase (NADP+)
MKNKLIGVVGFKNHELKKFEQKYKHFEFLNIEDKNFFSKKNKDLKALLVLYEWPVKNSLSRFLTKKYSFYKKLEWLHLSRAGIDECLPYLKNYKFKFTSGKKIQGPNVSEHCMSLLLALTRGLFSEYHKTNFLRPTEIKDKKVLIFGLGGIGLEIAKKIDSFGAEVYSVNNEKVKFKKVIKNYSLKQSKKIIKNFDIIINALPYTFETKSFFNKTFFSKMKKKSFFINISRDQTINIEDLKKFIKLKKFSGVAIDNTGSFRMKDKVYYDKKTNFILTDHQAGVSTNLERRKNLIFKNIDNYYKKRKLYFEVSKLKQY